MQSRRKKIVINQKFQQQYALAIVALTVVVANIFIILQSLIPSEQQLELSTGAAWAIGLFEIALVLGVWYGALKATHKVAGPIYVFVRELKRVGAGDLSARIALREKDMFREEATAINAGLEQLEIKVETVQKAATALRQAHAEGGATDAQIESLMAALGALRTGRED